MPTHSSNPTDMTRQMTRRLCLYVDEDAMSRALIRGLRSRGIDVVTVLDESMFGKSDLAQLEHASKVERVLYTFNVADYCRLHGQYLLSNSTHWGIIVVHRLRYAVGEQIRRLSKLVETMDAEEMRNRLLFL